MKPRMEVIGSATLYLGDCREILPTLGNIDVVTDPPYGIGFSYGEAYKDIGGSEYRNLIGILSHRPLALLHYADGMMRDICPVLGAPDDVLCWVYPSNLLGKHFRLWGLWGMKADLSRVKQRARNPEVAKVKNMMVNSYSWWEEPQVKNTTADKTAHPCQLPVSNVSRILRLTGTQNVADPFMGSGTTGIACIDLGLPFVGIEIEPLYFDLACKRIDDYQRQKRLFA